MKNSIKKLFLISTVAILLTGALSPTVAIVQADETIVTDSETIENSEITTLATSNTLTGNGVTVGLDDNGIFFYGHSLSGLEGIQQMMFQADISVDAFMFLLGLGVDPVTGFLAGYAVSEFVTHFAEAEEIILDMIDLGRVTGGVQITLSGTEPLLSQPE